MNGTPRERWGTCCPNDPECEHSFLDVDELTRWMDTPLDDIDLLRQAVMDEWGHNWQTSPAARRVLGAEAFEAFLARVGEEP
jgi:hypothetical protein